MQGFGNSSGGSSDGDDIPVGEGGGEPRLSLLDRFPLALSRPWIGYLAAGLMTLVAHVVRLVIDNALPPGFPFLTFFPAVAISALVFGAGPGLLSAAMGLVLSWYWFVGTQPGFVMETGAALALGLYVFVVAMDIGFIHLMQRANARLAAQREVSRKLAAHREVLFRELQHRVGNNLQMVSALINLQKRKLHDPGAVLALEEAARRIGLIGRIQRHLYMPDGGQIGLVVFLRQLLDDLAATAGYDRAAIRLASPDHLNLLPDQAIATALIVAESVSNSIEHGLAGQSGTITVDVTATPDGMTIRVEDDGRGLPADFAIEASSSLGLRLCLALARHHGGAYRLTRVNGRTVAALDLPGTH